MEELYTVDVAREAIRQVQRIRAYVSTALQEPETAEKLTNELEKAISSLEKLPQRAVRVQREPWNRMGIRRLLVRNYFVYYRIDESTKMVRVFAVAYAQSDQDRILRQMKLDESYTD